MQLAEVSGADLENVRGGGRVKTAIIHDWLVTYAGAERVLEQILDLYPDADIFTLVDSIPEKDRGFLKGKSSTTSFIQSLPWGKKKYRAYLPLMPLAIEQLDLAGYDLIISSSYAVAKGVITGPDQVHVSYVHSPMRYAWDLQNQYLKESGLQRGFRSFFVRSILHYIRMWDVSSSNCVDHFIVNSHFIARRVRKVYRRESQVIYPPVDVEGFSMNDAKDDFYLTASRMVPYKRIDLIVEAFAQMPDKKLVVIGDGPDMKKVQRQAAPNISVMGYQSFDVMKDHMQRAKAFVFAAEEDFGITPVESMACGTPVIAYGRGGALETIRSKEQDSEHPTGLFFHEQTPQAIQQAVAQFEQDQALYKSTSCRTRAELFSAENFKNRFSKAVDTVYRAYQQDRNAQFDL
ncbi:MAG: glycosyltransferase family 4 protein [Magnetococcales bacterium]|nr:glycosyltransferase family 4 protein [Magnetococcales bacterium]